MTTASPLSILIVEDETLIAMDLQGTLEDAGYRTLNDIIDLEREDFLKLPGIAPEEADRIMALIDELTTDDASETEEGSAT